MRRLSVVFLLFVAASLFLLDAGNAFAAPIAIRQSAKTVIVSRSLSPVLEARARQKGKSSSSNKTPGPSNNVASSSNAEARPGARIPTGTTATKVDVGAPPRPGAPEAFLVPKNSVNMRWTPANKAALKFLDHESKPNEGKHYLAQLDKAGREQAGTLYTEDETQKVGKPGKKQPNGFRVDNQGNMGPGMDFNIQAQKNGDDSETFATCIGETNCGANPLEKSAALQFSAKHESPVQLRPPPPPPPPQV